MCDVVVVLGIRTDGLLITRDNDWLLLILIISILLHLLFLLLLLLLILFERGTGDSPGRFLLDIIYIEFLPRLIGLLALA